MRTLPRNRHLPSDNRLTAAAVALPVTPPSQCKTNMDSIGGIGLQNRAERAPGRVNLASALAVWTRVSIAGIGGPALQIATMHRLLVDGKHWISEKRLYHALSCCIAMPGPDTQQLAIYVGWLAHRTLGAILAGGLFVLPGMICMLALSFGYVTGTDSQVGHSMFFAVRPAILAIMTQAVLRFGKHVILGRLLAAVAALAFVGAFVKIAFPVIVLAAGIIGACGSLPALRSSTQTPLGDQKQNELPDHARPSLVQFLRSLTMGLVLWLAPMLALLTLLGTQNVYTQIAIVFSKVALMAIGGDYAVIAYAAQQVVDVHHWLSAVQIQDGVALGEMVPGTIMIVTQFFGFLVAYRDPGALPPLVAGAFGGFLATWMTFAPCFLFILVVAPFIEYLRSNAVLSSALYAVTAAAVGMIANLTAWFGIRTLFHHIGQVHYGWIAFDVPILGSLDLWTSVLFALAAIAALRFKLSAVTILCASCAVSLTVSLFVQAG